MPKIPNYSRDTSGPFPEWTHDETGDSIRVYAGDDAEYHADGTPSEYRVDALSRDGTHHRNIDFGVSSLQEAKQVAVRFARDNPDGQLVRTKAEQFRCLDWGELRDEE
jgi:hypothetical protein